MRGPHQGERHVVRDRVEAVAHDLELEGVDGLGHRGHLVRSRSISTVPPASMRAVQSGGTTAVPSYSSMISGLCRGVALRWLRVTTRASTLPMPKPKYASRRPSGGGSESGTKRTSASPCGARDPTRRRLTISTGNSPEKAWP